MTAIQEILTEFGLKEAADVGLSIAVIIMTQYIKKLANTKIKKVLIPVWVSFLMSFVFHGATTFYEGAVIELTLLFLITFFFGWMKAFCITTASSFLIYHLAWEPLWKKYKGRKKEVKNEA